MDKETHEHWAWIFPLTFFIYALLQPIYLLKLWLSPYWMNYVFCAALLPKIINSISALKLIQMDTAKVQQLLEQRSVLEDLGALTTSIEHDIKNPLQVLETDISSMKKRFQSNAEIINAFLRIEEQTKRIFAATQIIPLIRGEKEYYEQFMGRINIKDLVNRSVKAVKKEFNTENIYFNVEDKDYFVKAYSPMLEQGIVNILRNAVEAIRDSDRKSGSVKISFSIIDKPENFKIIKIEFKDNGIGIEEDILKDVGKLFITTHSLSKPNSGIGLFITKRILRVHKGWLEMKNNKSEGANISLFLPIWKKPN